MIALKGMGIPKNCVKCNRIGLQQIIDCQLIYSGCANCGRHLDCPLVEIITCKNCKHRWKVKDDYGYEGRTFCECTGCGR